MAEGVNEQQDSGTDDTLLLWIAALFLTLIGAVLILWVVG
jgi:hypothetical protein